MSTKDKDENVSAMPSGPWARPVEDSGPSIGTSRTSLASSSISGSNSVASGGPWAVFDRGPSAASLSTIQLVEDGLRRRPPRYMLGSPGRRATAKLIDRIAVALALVPGLLVHLLGGAPLVSLVSTVIPGLAALGFEWYLTATLGQSPGKYLLGLRIISDSGDKVGFYRAVALRSWAMACGASVLAGIPWLVDLRLMFNDDRRTLHDRLAKTQVILADSLGDPYASL